MTNSNARVSVDKLAITGLHVEITPALRAHVEKRFRRLLKHEDVVGKVDIVLSVEKRLHRARCQLQTRLGHVVAEDRGENMYEQIDGLAHKVARQLREGHDKKGDHGSESGGLHPHSFDR